MTTALLEAPEQEILEQEAPAVRPDFSQLSTSYGKVLAPQDLELWSGPIALDLQVADKPVLRWKGAPLPAEIWSQLAGFFRHANETWRSEAQARLFYRAETREWRVVVVPQTVNTGMFSGEIKPVSLTVEQEKLRTQVFNAVEGFEPCGTAHSHCDCSAFQSGTDHKDELTQTGLHITFGRVSSDNMHIHGRVSFRGVLYNLDWNDWFPGWSTDLDARDPEFTYVVPPETKLEFPQDWLKCCFPPPPPKVYTHPAYKGTTGYGFDYRNQGAEQRTLWTNINHKPFPTAVWSARLKCWVHSLSNQEFDKRFPNAAVIGDEPLTDNNDAEADAELDDREVFGVDAAGRPLTYDEVNDEVEGALAYLLRHTHSGVLSDEVYAAVDAMRTQDGANFEVERMDELVRDITDCFAEGMERLQELVGFHGFSPERIAAAVEEVLTDDYKAPKADKKKKKAPVTPEPASAVFEDEIFGNGFGSYD